MKILHTADIHISTKEHLLLFENICNIARLNQCKVIIIAGDLFEDEISYKRFNQNLIDIINKFIDIFFFIIPGNHDIFLDNLNSQNTKLFKKMEICRFNNYNFLGIPYKEQSYLIDVIKNDENSLIRERNSIVIIHGTYLNTLYNLNEEKYFPFTKKDLEELNAKYIALGHYHKYIEDRIQNTYIINPGSPRITKETDEEERVVVIYDAIENTVEKILLDIEYNLPVDIEVLPSDNYEDVISKSMDKIKEKINNRKNRKFKLILRFKGYSSLDLVDKKNFIKESLKSELKIEDMTLYFKDIKFIDDKKLDNEFIRSLFEINDDKESINYEEYSDFVYSLIYKFDE